MAFQGHTLKVCVEQQASQSTTDVEYALRKGINKMQTVLIGHRKKLASLLHEEQLVKDLLTAMATKRAEVSAPLQQGKPHELSTVAVGNTGKGVRAMKAPQIASRASPTGQMEGSFTTSVKPRHLAGDKPASALQVEANEVAAFQKTADADRDALQKKLAELMATEQTLRDEMSWLEHTIRRDSDCLSSAPSRPAAVTSMYGAQQQPRATTSGSMASFVNGGGETTSTLSATPRSNLSQVRGSPRRQTPGSPRFERSLTPMGDRGRKRFAQGLTASAAAALDAKNWSAGTDATSARINEGIESSGRLRGRVESNLQKLTLRCANSRKTVIDALSQNIGENMRKRTTNVSAIETLDKRLTDTMKLWRESSQSAMDLKRPLAVVAERQRMRDATDDDVGAALKKEAFAIKRGRHELKKLCRNLGDEVRAMKAEKNSLQVEIQDLDRRVAEDRKWTTLEEPISNGSVPHKPRNPSKRVFEGRNQSGMHFMQRQQAIDSNAAAGVGSGIAATQRRHFQGPPERDTAAYVLQEENNRHPRIPAPPQTARR